MTVDDLELEVKLHNHFVKKGKESIDYIRGGVPPKSLQAALAYGLAQRWLKRDGEWDNRWQEIVWQVKLTEAGKERLFNRTK